MKTIQYLKGDATAPQAKGIKIIAHICNDIGGWGKGFVLAVSKRWEAPEKEYRSWHRFRSKNNFALGEIQLVQVEKYIYVANIIGQKGIKTGSNGVPVRYDAIEKALEKLSNEALQLNASIHMPRIGCGLAGGKWEEIEPIIERALLAKDLQVYVYDFE
ncbi:macro domain-containing protein [Chryseobacterium sediminis]|uniref:macro domain-containing protein n=1 Tax=Chryseobacterium sediminis TaxID=1679494 RepID=UPI0028673D67|nr:macro domain-containing protein [Chryseobacterium sediminis]MDR6463692.1 O-acetyl-ADP-ribose deacetylase (regulator of RNase III) [Chryseobacterium sediminis]